MNSIKKNINFEDGYFMGKENLKIYYKSYEVKDSKGSIVISHGFCESIERYKELIKILNQNNFSVYGLDHRGHGKSGRLGIDDSQINVEDFCESIERYKELIKILNQNNFSVYGLDHRGHGKSGRLGIDDSQINVEDLKTFLDSIVVHKLDGNKLFLFAHSMGGAIGSLFLEQYNNYFDSAILNAPMMQINTGNYPEIVSKLVAKFMCFVRQGNRYILGQYNNYFDSAILNAPMMQINTGNYPEIVSKLVAKFMCFVRQGNRYILGQVPFSGKSDLKGSGTSSEKRYYTYFNKQLRYKHLQTSGGSFNWLNQSFKAIRYIIKEENIKKITIPMLLFQAGKDTYVKPKGQNKFVSYSKNCKLILIKESKHEIYLERDEIFNPYIEQVINFYNQNLNLSYNN